MSASEFRKHQDGVDLQVANVEVESLRFQNTQLQRGLDERAKEVEHLERALGIYDRMGRAPRRPGWLTKAPRSSKKHHGIWHAMLSDLHLDEVVTPGEIFGMNAYNRQIAEARLKITFENIVRVARDWHSGVNIDGLVLMLGGDIFSGIIHDELRRTNSATILESVDFWVDPMAQGIQMLAEEFGSVYVPTVVGNHGRFDRKPVAKLRAHENYDWFFAKSIARSIRDRGIKGVTFDISDSPDITWDAYGEKILMTHGDQASGGSGWGGIMSPIMRLDDKKQKRQAAVKQPYDLLCIGHWHQLTWMPRGVINGSLKGYDEYAFQYNFGFEVPQQAMWLMTPEHGRTNTSPVFCQDAVAEGWKQAA